MARIDSPQIATVNGVDLCLQTAGDPDDPPILLIHGAAASMLGWPDELFEDLAAGGRYVVRYDHRDTGQSVSYPPGEPGYTQRDLVADAVGILDSLEIDRAHIAGISMGGGIAQVLGVEHPDRVASLTLMATSPGGSDLPPMSAEFLNFVSNATQPDWSDNEAVISHVLGLMRVFAGDSDRFDEPRLRRMLERDVQRSTVNPASMQVNHFAIEHGEPVRPRLGEIQAPALVIQGALDPVFPPGHGDALAREIPSAELVTLEDSGHLMLWQAGESLSRAILRHTAGVQV